MNRGFREQIWLVFRVQRTLLFCESLEIEHNAWNLLKYSDLQTRFHARGEDETQVWPILISVKYHARLYTAMKMMKNPNANVINQHILMWSTPIQVSRTL